MKALLRKHGEITVRPALTHIFEVGYDHFNKYNIDQTIDRIKAGPKKNGLLSGEQQIAILECVKDIIDHSLWDILKFVKTDIDIDNVTVTTGKIVQLRYNCTGETICTVIAPNDVDQFDINDVEEKVGDALDAYLTANNGDADGFDYYEAVMKAFADIGKRAKCLQPHFIFYT